jgi:hypothetical protein
MTSMKQLFALGSELLVPAGCRKNARSVPAPGDVIPSLAAGSQGLKAKR